MRGAFRDALRLMRREPAFSVPVLISLALVIGGNTALFSAVNVTLIRPLPVGNADQLVVVTERRSPTDAARYPLSATEFREWQQRDRPFSTTTAYFVQTFTLLGPDGPDAVKGAKVSADFFRLLSVRPERGRDFTADDDRPGAAPVAIVGRSFWRQQFGDAPLAGQVVRLDGRPIPIVGIVPALEYPRGAAIWLPLGLDYTAPTAARFHFLTVIARVTPGLSLREAQMIARDRPTTAPAGGGDAHAVQLVTLAEALVGDVRTSLVVLQIAVSFLLLLGCANAATFFLAQVVRRRTEMAVRTVLGATRSHLLLQTVTVSLVVTLCAAVAGFVLARWTVAFLVPLLPRDIPRLQQIPLDRTVLGFTLLVAFATALLASVPPALQFRDIDPSASLSDGGRSPLSRRSVNLARGLVAVEFALTLILLVGAGLAIKTLDRLRAVDIGFNPERTLTAAISAPRTRYAGATKIADFFAQVVSRAEQLPSVRAAGAVLAAPMIDGSGTSRFSIDECPSAAPLLARSNVVTPGYFNAMGIALKSGRAFTARDTKTNPAVAIANESFVRAFCPDREPLGVHVRLADPRDQSERVAIVGVVADVRQAAVGTPPAPELFFPHAQSPSSRMTLVVRTKADPAGSLGELRRAVRDVDDTLPLLDVTALDAAVTRDLAPPRLRATLLGLFAALAVTVALVGLGGLMSYVVSFRVPEIGLRVALGAPPAVVIRQTMQTGLSAAAVGLLLGLGGALAITRYSKGLLHEVSATDPAVFGLVLLLLAAVAIAAAWIPARRAAGIDPAAAMRQAPSA